MPENTEKIRAISSRLMEIAPWPGWGDEATAASVARYLAVNAQMAFAMHITPFSGTDGSGRLDPDVIARINAQFAAAHSLLALREAAPDDAEAVAKEIATAWSDGQGVGEWLWDHLGRVVSEEVERLAEDKLAAGVVPPKPRVVCLCGSTRFYGEFRKANLERTLAGEIVLSIGCDFRSDGDLAAAGELGEDPEVTKQRMDGLRKQKIAMSDEILVVSDESGYYGDSTRSEIAHARSLGRPVRFQHVAAAERVATSAAEAVNADA